MQCPRCGATAPDTTSRCGRCDFPLPATPAAHPPVAAPIPDGPPPIQQQPLGAPLYDSGPPVQAFVEPAEDSWRPLTYEAAQHAPAPPAPPESPGESTLQWTPAHELDGGREAAPPPMAPLPPLPPPGNPGHGNGLPPNIDPASVVPGHDLVLPATPGPGPAERTEPQQPLTASSMGQLPPPLSAPPGPGTPESVAERTMAVWLSESPPASGGPGPFDTPGPGAPQGYGAIAPPPGGYGGNATAMLPGMSSGPQPGGPDGWQSETWQTTGAWQQPPGHDITPRPAGGNAGKPLIITVVGLVVVALVAAGVVLWPDGGGSKGSAAATAGPSAAAANSPATSKANPAGRREAVAVNRLLNVSAASRGGLARALAAASTCKGLPTAIVGFQQVATQRRTQVARARALKVRNLANGVRLRQTLTRSIQYSLAVDQALLVWAQSRQGCKGKPKPDANYQRARGPLSEQASAAKRQFAALWAPVAKQHRLPARTANGF